jgi:hypothetical protein
MPMTKEQRENALADLKSDMKTRFGGKLSDHDLFFAREHASKIAAQHHDKGLHECIVVHVKVIPMSGYSYQASLDYGLTTRYGVSIRDDDDNIVEYLGEQSPEMGEAVAQALKALRVPTRLKSTKLTECGCCGSYHPVGFNEECRDDGNRFPCPNDSDDVESEELIG